VKIAECLMEGNYCSAKGLFEFAFRRRSIVFVVLVAFGRFLLVEDAHHLSL